MVQTGTYTLACRIMCMSYERKAFNKGLFSAGRIGSKLPCARSPLLHGLAPL